MKPSGELPVVHGPLVLTLKKKKKKCNFIDVLTGFVQGKSLLYTPTQYLRFFSR